MDEAERCHRLAYLAYGKLLTRGTVDGGHRAGGSDDLGGERARTCAELADAVAAAARRRQVVAFGNRFTSAATMPKPLETGIAPFRDAAL